MLKDLNKVKDEPSTSKLNVMNKNKEIITVETGSSNSEATSDEEINKNFIRKFISKLDDSIYGTDLTLIDVVTKESYFCLKEFNFL